MLQKAIDFHVPDTAYSHWCDGTCEILPHSTYEGGHPSWILHWPHWLLIHCTWLWDMISKGIKVQVVSQGIGTGVNHYAFSLEYGAMHPSNECLAFVIPLHIVHQSGVLWNLANLLEGWPSKIKVIWFLGIFFSREPESSKIGWLPGTIPSPKNVVCRPNNAATSREWESWN